MNAGRFGIVTRWQHLPCTIFADYLESEEGIEGYEYLNEEQQALVKTRVEQSRDEEDEDAKPIDPSELVRKEWTTQKEPPETLVLPILPYQKEGLGWMFNQEQIEYHGGILADEMVSPCPAFLPIIPLLILPPSRPPSRPPSFLRPSFLPLGDGQDHTSDCCHARQSPLQGARCGLVQAGGVAWARPEPEHACGDLGGVSVDCSVAMAVGDRAFYAGGEFVRVGLSWLEPGGC